MEENIVSFQTIQEVINYIEDKLTEELTPAAIAEQFYISESTLTMLFKLACGMTIMEYIRNRRLTMAGEELTASNIRIIDLAYKYGYETPEAFTKAFSRCFGFPPSFVRRAFPITKRFQPLQIDVAIQGGWTAAVLTNSDAAKQDSSLLCCYDKSTNNKGGLPMGDSRKQYQIELDKMQYQKEWKVLCSLAGGLQKSRIPFKVDGKTMIFAHGIEFPLEKICLTFKWNEEDKAKAFFCYEEAVKYSGDGFKYFDVMYEGMKVRCMFYGECQGDDTDEFLYRNTDLVQMGQLTVPVQSLQFYYENAQNDSEYDKLVGEFLQSNP